ncbi:MAG: arsenite methyltransferase [Planctomycetota bacterium]
MGNLRQYYGKASQNAQDYGSSAAGPTDPITQATSIGYSKKELQSVPEGSVMGMGCGNPTVLAKLQEGETVLDLGCGGGLDVFLAALKVGKNGHVIGIDMTQEMLDRAKTNAIKGDYKNAEFLLGDIENVPVKDNSVDVVISNCVINYALDKARVFREALRCLKPCGRLLVSDLVVQGEFGDDALQDEIWGAWIANALGKQEYLNAIEVAGFKSITIMTENLFNLSEADDRLKGKISSISVEAYK